MSSEASNDNLFDWGAQSSVVDGADQMRDNTVSNGLKEFGLDSYPGFDIDSSIVSKPDENQRANHDLADESLYEASGHDIVTVKLLENGALTTTMEPSSSEELSSTMELSSTIEPNSTMEPNSTGSMNEDDIWSSSSFSVETGMSETSTFESSATSTAANSEYTEYDQTTDLWENTSMAISSSLSSPPPSTEMSELEIPPSSTAMSELNMPSSTSNDDEETALPAAFKDISLTPMMGAQATSVALSSQANPSPSTTSSVVVSAKATNSSSPASSSATSNLSSSVVAPQRAAGNGPAAPPPPSGSAAVPSPSPTAASPPRGGAAPTPTPAPAPAPAPAPSSQPPKPKAPAPGGGAPGGASGGASGAGSAGRGGGGPGSPGMDYAGPNGGSSGKSRGVEEDLASIGQIGVFESRADSQYRALGSIWMWIAVFWFVWMTLKQRH